MRKIGMCVAFLALSLLLQAQESIIHPCVSMEADSISRANYPERGTLNDFENWLQKEIKLQNQNPKTLSATLLTIPVIVHIIHDGENIGSGSNISAAQVYSQIDVLNEDFRRLNSDTGNTPSVFKPVAADMEIEFCPAVIDTNGVLLAEPGINRIDRNIAGFSAPSYTRNYTDLTIKPATQWDPKKYLNIWVLHISGGIAGWAQFPDSSTLSGAGYTPNASSKTDGIAIYYKTFGTTGNVLSAYNKGRSCTHEAGHFFGIRHIWGDSNCGNDHCSDTPTQQGYYTGCPSFPQITCSNGPNGAMFTNFMDYTSDACKNIFTEDQKTRLRTVMNVSPRRRELPFSTACIAPVVSGFTTSDTSICAGDTINFVDTSSNNPTSWQWTFQGGIPASSTLQNPQVTYSAAGTYSVSLSAKNVNGGDTIKRYTWVNVYQASTPVITQNGYLLSSSPANSYQWYRNDTLLSGASSQTHTVTLDGIYAVVTTDINGCTAKNSIVVSLSKITELSNKTSILIYPNPTNNTFHITSEKNIDIVEVKNILSKTVLSETNLNTNKAEMTLEVPGIYVVTVWPFEGEPATYRLLVK